ncbi:MAG: hypothetical protein ACQR33_03935 [Candidatus Saccharibacteria bacterium]
MKKTSEPQTSPQVSMKWRLIIGVSSAVFVISALAPFLVRASQNFFSVGSRLLGWGPQGAIQGAPQISIGWIRPPSITIFGACSMVVIVILGGTVLWQARRASSYREIRRVSSIQLCIAVAVIALTCATYTVMRQHSQAVGVGANNGQAYRLGGNNAAHCARVTLGEHDSFSFSDASCIRARTVPQARFGYGSTPVYVVLESIAYGLPALLTWYRFRLSPSRIGGQKKGELFQ